MWADLKNSGSQIGGRPGGDRRVPGKARSPEELRSDLELAYRLIPGRHRLNLHASYGEFSSQHVERNAIEPRHFQGWIDWAKDHHLGLDFNPTYFAHPLAQSGLTLTHPDEAIRKLLD